MAAGPGRPVESNPTLTGWKPSTSFSGATASRMRCESMWAGRGSCTRIPSISGRAFSSRTIARSSSVVSVAGGVSVSLCMPSSAAVFVLLRTYTSEAGLFPTRTTARPGGLTNTGNQLLNTGPALGFYLIANAISIEDCGHQTNVTDRRNSLGASSTHEQERYFYPDNIDRVILPGYI